MAIFNNLRKYYGGLEEEEEEEVTTQKGIFQNIKDYYTAKPKEEPTYISGIKTPAGFASAPLSSLLKEGKVFESPRWQSLEEQGRMTPELERLKAIGSDPPLPKIDIQPDSITVETPTGFATKSITPDEYQAIQDEKERRKDRQEYLEKEPIFQFTQWAGTQVDIVVKKLQVAGMTAIRAIMEAGGSEARQKEKMEYLTERYGAEEAEKRGESFIYQQAEKIGDYFDETIGELYKKPVANWSTDVVNNLTREQQLVLAPLQDEKEGLSSWEEYGTAITQGAFSMLGAIGITYLTGNTALAAGFLSSIEASAEYNNARDAGLLPEEARRVAVASGVGTFFLEKAGLDFLFKYKGPSRIVKSLLAGGVETGQELTQTVFQNYVIKFGYNEAQDVFEGLFETVVGILPVSLVAGYFIPVSAKDGAINDIMKKTDVSRETAEKLFDEMVSVAEKEKIKLANEVKSKEVVRPVIPTPDIDVLKPFKIEAPTPEVKPEVKAPPVVEKPKTPVAEVTKEIEPLAEEARKYDSADEFYNAKGTSAEFRNAGIRGKEQFTKFFNENVEKVIPILDDLNPTGGLLVDYSPKTRMTMELGKNITTLDKTAGKSADEIITIYRGAPKNQKGIVGGDFVTTNYNLAKSYTGVDNVLSKEVKMSDVLDDITEPLGEEYIYRPETKITPEERKVKIAENIKKRYLKLKTKEGFSRHYERVKDIFGFGEAGVEFEKKVNKEQAKKAFDYIQRNPQKAMRIAYGYDNAPESINPVAIRQSLVASLRRAGKIAQAEEISKLVTLDFTKAAQTLNLAKLEVSPSGEVVITKSITDARLEKLGNSLGEVDSTKAVEKAKGEIITRSKKASQEVVTEQVTVANQNLRDLDDLIDKIIC